MIKIIGGYKEREGAPLQIIVEDKDAVWVLYKDEGTEAVYSDFVPVASLEELEIVPNVEIDEATKEQVLSVLLKNRNVMGSNVSFSKYVRM